MTNVTYIGNATSDAELRFTQNGVAVASINLAVNTRSKRGEEYVDDPTLFIRVTAWKDMAENVGQSVRKGDRLIVVGRQKQTEFTTRDGDTRQQLEVTADEIGPSLRWATAEAQKVQRSGGRGGAPQGGYGQQPQQSQGYGQQAPQQGYAAPPQPQGYDDQAPPF